MQVCPSCNKRTKTKVMRVPKSRRTVQRRDVVLIDKALKIATNIGELLETEAHYSVVANEVQKYHTATGYSERKMAGVLSISKSEIHRLLILASLPHAMKEAALTYNTEKYVLLEWSELPDPVVKNSVKIEILTGRMRLRSHFKRFVKSSSKIT